MFEMLLMISLKKDLLPCSGGQSYRLPGRPMLDQRGAAYVAGVEAADAAAALRTKCLRLAPLAVHKTGLEGWL